ncbi:MAG: hypothetical protein QNJ45_07085 [Ardenticatenaceae bacterium]|nr:hypothetical protein [Ardenticatenaceae bacterium]
MDFLTEFGITQTDLINITAIVVVLLIILGALRAVFRLTRTLMRTGCVIIFLIAGFLLLLSYLNPV